MKKLILALACLFTLPAFAAATINPMPVQGAGVVVQVALDYPGTVTVAGFQPQTMQVVSGDCQIDSRFNQTGPNIVSGFTCFDAGVVQFHTYDQINWICPYEGAFLESPHLRIALDGEVIYDQPIVQNLTTTCSLIPTLEAVRVWSPPTLTFDNTAQNRTSLSTAYYNADSAWTYANHVFNVPAGVVCGPYTPRIRVGYKYVYRTQGFVCNAVVPANSSLTVTIQ